MIGWVYVLERQQYRLWLAQGDTEAPSRLLARNCFINSGSPIAIILTVTARAPTCAAYLMPVV